MHGRRSESPTGSPLFVKPAGTEIAGFAMNVTYQHERIQSMYVAIGVPAISVGYGDVDVERRDLRHRKHEVLDSAGKARDSD